MKLRFAFLLLTIVALAQMPAQEPVLGSMPGELVQLRRQFEIQSLTSAKLLSEQFVNALTNVAREVGAEGDYDQALAAQRRRERLILLYTNSLESDTLNNAIVLKPEDARISGAVTYDRPANLLVGWKTVGSVASWDLTRLTPGSYDVTLSYIGAELPGEIKVPELGAFEFYEDSSLPGAELNRRKGVVESPFGAGNGVTMKLPPIQITRTSARLVLKITRANGYGGVMNFQNIRLTPPSALTAADPQAATQLLADELASLKQSYVDRLREAVNPVLTAYAENMKTLAEKHAGSDANASEDYATEAQRAQRLLEDPEDILATHSKRPRPGMHLEGFHELRDAVYVADPGNSGDRFKVKQEEQEYFVRLLWVSCPPKDDKEGKRLKEHASYFGIDAEDAQDMGRQAGDFTSSFLTGKSLTLFTRGAKDDEGDLLVSIRVEGTGDFAGVLVDRGLALIRGPSERKGPARQREETILHDLQEREKAVKNRRVPPGAWARRNVE